MLNNEDIARDRLLAKIEDDARMARTMNLTPTPEPVTKTDFERQSRQPINTSFGEHGLRSMVRCVLPYNYDSDSDALYVRLLKRHLSDMYGGYTSYRSEGGWNVHDELMVETGEIIEVSCYVGHEAIAKTAFESTARQLGQTWAHIEVHTFEAHHANVKFV